MLLWLPCLLLYFLITSSLILIKLLLWQPCFLLKSSCFQCSCKLDANCSSDCIAPSYRFLLNGTWSVFCFASFSSSNFLRGSCSKLMQQNAPRAALPLLCHSIIIQSIFKFDQHCETLLWLPGSSACLASSCGQFVSVILQI